MTDKNKVMEWIDELDLEFVRLQFSDIDGLIKNVSIPAARIDKAFDEGIYFDGSSIEGFVRIQESDMRLEPDPETFSVLPFEESMTGGRGARLICDVYHPDGRPFYGDPRFLLKRVTTRAKEMGYEFMAGPEPEFFVFKTEDGQATVEPSDEGGYFDLAPRDQAVNLRGSIIDHLHQMGYQVEASHHEVARGQQEIDFKYDTGLKTADNIATFRMVVRAVAAMNDLHATFMPKPVAGINGSGMHTHMSLFDEDGENAFHDPVDEFDLSDVGRSFLAGLLEHAPAITAVTNPTVNSYKRLVPGYEAPIYVAWSDVNRSALIRKPASDKSEGTRIEYRSPDPSCNPYLYLTVCLRAGLDGIERDLKAPAPIRENIYELTEEKRENYGIDVLPGNLEEAVQALKEDDIIRDALGTHASKLFVESRMNEYRNYSASVSDWELDQYLELF